MHGLLRIRRALRRRLREERGWALVEAVASVAVVVLAFVGTTMAFNGSTASVMRDQQKTQAMIVAQNEINRMRGVAQRDIGDLTAMDDTTRTVNYRGVDYTVAYSAYYVTGLGSDQQSACENSYTSGGGTARYIYMRVKVSYEGQTMAGAGNPSSYLSAPASLDSYFSPEGGGVQSGTGTLRIYVLDRNNDVAGGVSSVKLYITGTSTPITATTTNLSTGCYLFTGLERNNYEVKAVVSGKQDMYMTNSSTLGSVRLPVVMPDRGALSREIRLDNPVTVTPKFYTKTESDPKLQVTSGNAFFAGGAWVAASDQIRSAPTDSGGKSDFSYMPSGIVFMPHQTTPTAGTLPTGMFPSVQGYSTWAGPCDANDPNAGVDEFTNNQVQLPVTIPNGGWVPNANYTALELWLTQLRTSVTVTPNAEPTSTFAPNHYYYNQAFNGNATVRVRLVGDQNGGTTVGARCRPNTDLFNTWQTLGTLSSSGVTLSDSAEALPAGSYDVCVTWPWKQGHIYYTSSWSGWTKRTETQTGTSYFFAPALALKYNTPQTLAFQAWGSVSSSSPNLDSYGQTTDCTS